METNQIYDTIQRAIDAKMELSFNYKHGIGGEISNVFHAYILGDDTMQYSFVWGYLPDQGLYYKFMLSNIVSAKLLTKKYAVREDACYQYSIEEEHFNRVEGFTNSFGEAARLAGQ